MLLCHANAVLLTEKQYKKVHLYMGQWMVYLITYITYLYITNNNLQLKKKKKKKAGSQATQDKGKKTRLGAARQEQRLDKISLYLQQTGGSYRNMHTKP
jgi:hypothetical protein